jgi:hypothetical protein
MVALLAAWIVGHAQAAETWSISNSLHVEYDDNITQTESDEVDSVKISNELTLSLLAYPGELSRVGLRYHVIATWWDERESDDWTFDHMVDFDWNQKLAPQLELNVTDRYIYRDNSELIDEDGRTVAGDASYNYNALNGAVNVGITANTLVAVAGRWQLLRYDDALEAEQEDYDIYAAGVTLRNQYRRDGVVLGELRYEQTEYVDGGKVVDYTLDLPGAPGGQRRIPDRSHSAVFAGVGLEEIFNPKLSGRITAGCVMRDFDEANTDDETAPYADAAMTFTPSDRTRMTIGASYSLHQSSLLTFAAQRRAAVSASVSHDLTTRLSLNLSGTYVNSDYDKDLTVDTVEKETVRDGSEDAVAVAARAVYWVDRARKHALEAGWTLTDLSSDLRSEYTRNRYDVAWRIQL